VHDPELIYISVKIKRLGFRVVFDSHEDVPQQLRTKPYLNKPLLWLISKAFALFEAWSSAKFNGVIAATSTIRAKFLLYNSNTIDINNYPLVSDIEPCVSWTEKRSEVCYVGDISKHRGICQICTAMELVRSSVRLNLAGSFVDPKLGLELRSMTGWRLVNSLGFLDRAGVRDVLARSLAGLVTLHPLINYLDALPVKMFEYMSAGIPVIASDFPLWRKIISDSNCGLLVDPFNPDEIALAIDTIVSRPEMAQLMGENGRRAVMQRYNWGIEEQKLLQFYRQTIDISQ
jgi:glycosyltransferase involved in cell wall biosynthesis